MWGMGRNGGRREDGGRISPHGGREDAGLTERVFAVWGMYGGTANRDGGRTGRTSGGLTGAGGTAKGNIIPCYVAFYVPKGT